MKRKLLILIVFCNVFVAGFANDFYSEKTALKVARMVLKDKNIELVKKVTAVNIDEKNEPLVIYEFRRINNSKNFFCVFTQAKGRYDYFDYLIVVNRNFEIEKVSVLKYRSEHGGEIASKKWLSQFEKYSGGSLHYKNEISALSGATISANSLVSDVPKVLKILKSSCE